MRKLDRISIQSGFGVLTRMVSSNATSDGCWATGKNSFSYRLDHKEEPLKIIMSPRSYVPSECLDEIASLSTDAGSRLASSLYVTS